MLIRRRFLAAAAGAGSGLAAHRSGLVDGAAAAETRAWAEAVQAAGFKPME